MKGNNKCCSRILPHTGKWNPYCVLGSGRWLTLWGCPVSWWVCGSTLEHLLSILTDLGSILITTKNRKRDIQQHGTINFSCHLVSNCYDFQRNSLLTNFKTIRRCEEAIEHVCPSPGRGPWCPFMGMPKHKQAWTTNSEFTVWCTRGSKCKVATQGGAVTNAEVPQASSHTEGPEGSKFKT